MAFMVPLPQIARDVGQKLGAPPRLMKHLEVVHDVAQELSSRLAERFPGFKFNADMVALGAAVHDLAKAKFPEELVGDGNRHEIEGPAILEAAGVPRDIAAFARDHGRAGKSSRNDVLIVAMADAVWKGVRPSSLEMAIVDRISQETGMAMWEVWSRLDVILEEIAVGADARLEYCR
jgi:hypothetical protein